MSFGDGRTMLPKGKLCNEAMEIRDLKGLTSTLWSTLLYLPLLKICQMIARKKGKLIMIPELLINIYKLLNLAISV